MASIIRMLARANCEFGSSSSFDETVLSVKLYGSGLLCIRLEDDLRSTFFAREINASNYEFVADPPISEIRATRPS